MRALRMLVLLLLLLLLLSSSVAQGEDGNDLDPDDLLLLVQELMNDTVSERDAEEGKKSKKKTARVSPSNDRMDGCAGE